MNPVEVKLADGLCRSLDDNHFDDPTLHISDVAICLSAKVKPDQFAKDKENPRIIAQAALSIRDAALQERLDLPVLVILELPAGVKGEEYAKFRETFNRWASDQDWHRGDFALYLCPPIDPASDDWKKWQGPKTRAQMVERLLGEGVADWQVEPVDRKTELMVAEDLEKWCNGSEKSHSGQYRDLIQSVATSLRRLHGTVETNRNSQKEEERTAVKAIGRWVEQAVDTALSAPPGQDKP